MYYHCSPNQKDQIGWGDTSFRRIMRFMGSLGKLFRGSCRIWVGGVHCRCREINQSTLQIHRTKRIREEEIRLVRSKSEIERKREFKKITCPRTIRISSVQACGFWIWEKSLKSSMCVSRMDSSASSSLSPSGLWSEGRWLCSIYPLGFCLFHYFINSFFYFNIIIDRLLSISLFL